MIMEVQTRRFHLSTVTDIKQAFQSCIQQISKENSTFVCTKKQKKYVKINAYENHV